MPSMVAEIGDVLDRHMRRIGLIKDEALSEEHTALLAEKREAATKKAIEEPVDSQEYPPGAQLCTKCMTTAMILMDGCMTCLSCGDSKCG